MLIRTLLFLVLSVLHLSGGDDAENPKTFQKPFIEHIEGWPVEWNQEFKKKNNKNLFSDAKKVLANHLQRITYILDPEKVKQLQNLFIRVDINHKLGNMQYHPSRGWLISNEHDPSMEKRVHIPRAKQLLSKEQWAKHPYVILHELAHSYHDQVLGFDNMDIINAYRRSEKAGLYEKVLLFRGGLTRHYARTNHKEFFAEMTESYLGVNDFYPFVRAELKIHDPKTFALMEKIWGEI
jgi:dipeptidyl-peptidase-4